MNNMIFSHNDLDGVMSPFILTEGLSLFEETSSKIRYMGYEDFDTKISQFITSKKYLNYDRLFILDASVSIDVAKLIDTVKDEIEIHLLDHHDTALELNQFDWANVQVIYDEKFDFDYKKTSGTSLVVDYLTENLDRKSVV